MLKAAKVRFGASVVDCLVLDMSPTGIRISTDGFMAFPETALLELRSGGVWSVQRRWQRGMETGFEVLQFAGLHAQAIQDASALYDRLCNAGIRDVTERLAAARYFDHEELRATAAAVDSAVAALERVLQVACGRT